MNFRFIKRSAPTFLELGRSLTVNEQRCRLGRICDGHLFAGVMWTYRGVHVGVRVERAISSINPRADRFGIAAFWAWGYTFKDALIQPSSDLREVQVEKLPDLVPQALRDRIGMAIKGVSSDSMCPDQIPFILHQIDDDLARETAYAEFRAARF